MSIHSRVTFARRSYAAELLDDPAVPFADIKRNMQELDTINTLLGGHKVTLRGLEMLLGKLAVKTPLHIAEIGCGDGNNLRVIRKWAQRKGWAVRLTGIDYNPSCIRYAQSIAANRDTAFICSDYSRVTFEHPPDIIFSSLFCHHFTDTALVRQLQWMQQQSRLGFFINDLHRHPFAYYSIRLLTRIFSRSYLVKHDAPLSVLRGFSRRDWQAILAQAGVGASLHWAWAFRWLVTCTAGGATTLVKDIDAFEQTSA